MKVRGSTCSEEKFYHIVLSVYRTKRADLLISVLPFKNRQGLDGGIRFAGKHRELLTKGFLIRAAQEYNSVPVLVSIRSKTSLPAFKQQLKEWVKSYIPSD